MYMLFIGEILPRMRRCEIENLNTKKTYFYLLSLGLVKLDNDRTETYLKNIRAK